MRRLITVIGIAVATIGTIGILSYVAFVKGFASVEAAAWLQAIGSVGAILGAIWIARAAERRADTKSKLDVAVSLHVLSGVAAHAYQTIDKAEEAYTNSRKNLFGSRNYSMHIAALKDAASALQSLPLEKIPAQSGIITNVMTLRRTLLEAVEVLQDARMNPDEGDRLITLRATAETCSNGIASGARALGNPAGLDSPT